MSHSSGPHMATLPSIRPSICSELQQTAERNSSHYQPSIPFNGKTNLLALRAGSEEKMAKNRMSPREPRCMACTARVHVCGLVGRRPRPRCQLRLRACVFLERINAANPPKCLLPPDFRLPIPSFGRRLCNLKTNFDSDSTREAIFQQFRLFIRAFQHSFCPTLFIAVGLK